MTTRILREPLLHFVVLGAVIFAAYGWISNRSSGEPGQIVITQGQIASMVEAFALTRQRPPTSDEVEGLVRDRVRDEVYYREALALGLDKDDGIIRARLRQKMAFLTDDVVAQAEPTDDELNAYLKAHPDAFRLPRLFSFSQVFLDPEKHGENLAGDAAQLLSQLNRAGSAADISALGDPIMLDHEFDALPAGEVTKLFGEDFAATLGGLSPGQWQGPVTSAYGVHLVLVSERTEGRVPALSEVRHAVQRDWTDARRVEANEKFYGEMLKRYSVTIEPPVPVAEQKRLKAAK